MVVTLDTHCHGNQITWVLTGNWNESFFPLNDFNSFNSQGLVINDLMKYNMFSYYMVILSDWDCTTRHNRSELKLASSMFWFFRVHITIIITFSHYVNCVLALMATFLTGGLETLLSLVINQPRKFFFLVFSSQTFS